MIAQVVDNMAFLWHTLWRYFRDYKVRRNPTVLELPTIIVWLVYGAMEGTEVSFLDKRPSQRL